MRNCRPIQLGILLLCSVTVVCCVAQGSGTSVPGGGISHRKFTAGLALLEKHECKQAALNLQQVVRTDPGLVEARILLGLAYDCSGDRANLAAAFHYIWDHDLDPQESTPETAIIERALNAGLKFQTQTPQGNYFTALLYYRVGHYDSSLATLQAVPAPVADSWAYNNLLGSIYLRQAHFSEAKQALEAAVQRDDRQADSFYKLGTVLLSTGDVAAATAELKRAVTLRPEFPAASAALGIALLQAGDFAAARDSLAKGGSVGAEVYVYLGTANERLNDSKAAIENYETAIAQQPNLFAAQFSLGRLLLTSGDLPNAIKRLQTATQLAPDNAQAQLYLAMALVAAKQTENAAAAAARAMTSGASENADFHDALGTVFQDVGQQERALQSFSQAVILDPTKENYYRHLAAAQHKSGDGPAAIATLRSGIARLPTSARVNYLLGISLMANGSSADASQPLRSATQLEPGNAEYEQALGLCLAELEKDAEAMAAFRQVLTLDPNHAPAYLQIGLLQLKTNPEEAEQSFKKAINIDPNYAPAYFRLGKLYYDRNDTAQALTFLEKTRDLDPDWEDTYFLLGTLYRRAGNEERSAQMMAIFRKKKNELQDLRRKTFDMAPDAFDDAKPASASR
jgi:tetratricopeptide (TPR) repeat protein